MTITNVKSTLGKVAAMGLLAGAVAIAAPAKANAQVAFGVRVGPVAVSNYPVYVRPYPYGYYRPYGYGYGYGYRAYPHYGYGYRHGYR